MYELVKTNKRCRKERNTYENKTYNKGFNYRRRLWCNLFSAAHGVVFSPDHCSNPLSGNAIDCRIILGTVYMLYATKVPRTGAILVLAILVGLITSMATIYPLIFAVVWGLIAELITAKRRKSAGALAVSYCVFNLTSMGPFFALILAKDAFLESCAGYYGEEYIATLDKLTPSWIVLVLIALALVGGLLGGLFGRKILKKHFVKAGITA